MNLLEKAFAVLKRFLKWGVTNLFMDVAMIGQAIATGIAILSLLDPKNSVDCDAQRYDINVNNGPDPFSQPEYISKSQVFAMCKPLGPTSSARDIFLILFILHQLVYVVAIVMRHWGLFRWRKRAVEFAFFLPVLSFLLTFGKLAVVLSLTAQKLNFDCNHVGGDDHGKSSPLGNRTLVGQCDSLSLPVNITALAPNLCAQNPGQCQERTLDCDSACRVAVPSEVYILVGTFVMSFLYIVYLCVEYYGQDPYHIIDLVPHIEKKFDPPADEHDSDHQVPRKVERRDSAVSLRTLHDDQAEDGDVLYSHRPDFDVNIQDKRATVMYLRNKKLFYRCVRDMVAATKFIVQFVAILGLLGYGLGPIGGTNSESDFQGGELVSCDSFAAGGTTFPGNVVRETCGAQTHTNETMFVFVITSVLVFCIFVWASFLEKSVSFERQSAWITVFSIIGALILVSTQAATLFGVGDLGLSFICQQPIGIDPAYNLTAVGFCSRSSAYLDLGSSSGMPGPDIGHCVPKQANSTANTNEWACLPCHDLCSVAIPPSLFSLYLQIFFVCAYLVYLLIS